MQSIAPCTSKAGASFALCPHFLHKVLAHLKSCFIWSLCLSLSTPLKERHRPPRQKGDSTVFDPHAICATSRPYTQLTFSQMWAIAPPRGGKNWHFVRLNAQRIDPDFISAHFAHKCSITPQAKICYIVQPVCHWYTPTTEVFCVCAVFFLLSAEPPTFWHVVVSMNNARSFRRKSSFLFDFDANLRTIFELPNI